MTKTLVCSWRSAPFSCSPLALAACGGDASPATPSPSVGDATITKAALRPLAERRAIASAASRPPRRPRRADARRRRLHGVHRGQEARPRRSRPRASPATTDAQLKAQCKQEYERLRDQVMQFLIRAEWIEGEAADQGVKVTDKEVAEAASTTAKKQSFPKEARLPEVPQAVGHDARTTSLFQRRSSTRCSQRSSARRSPRASRQGHRRADRGLLQQEQERASRSPRRATCAIVLTKTEAAGRRRPRRRSQSGQSFDDGRQEVLDRPGLQGQRRHAARRRQGPAGEGVRRRDLRRQARAAHRPGQDAVRLLRLPGHRRSRRPSSSRSSRPRPTIKQHARRAEPAEGADAVRQGLPQEVEGQDELPRRPTSIAGLQERAEGQATTADGRRRAQQHGRRRRRRRRARRRLRRHAAGA